LSGVPAVAKMAEAPSWRESWMPAAETPEAPACQRMDLPEENSLMRVRAWSAVIHVWEGAG